MQLFQLRSIEQNELAIVADSQNKAIFVFTGATLIFMPVSFFASYFGMNVDGVINAGRSEKYFWEVCGTFSFVIIGIVAAIVLRRQAFVRLNRMNANDYMMQI